jgi:quinol monooxygenase YgiN
LHADSRDLSGIDFPHRARLRWFAGFGQGGVLAMSAKALYVGMEARSGKQSDVSEFLFGAREVVKQEIDTKEWYALRFGASSFAIFDTFPDSTGRLKHLLGGVGRRLVVKTFTILSGLPKLALADIIAAKKPPLTAAPQLALFVWLKAKAGQEQAVATLLSGALADVQQEAGTIAWYALKTGPSSFAICDVFASEADRDAHLSGNVANALRARAAELFDGAPDIRKAEVLAYQIKA